MVLYEFCKICHGIQKVKCLFCGLTITHYRKISEVQVNHYLYLRGTWLKLKRFKMLTTGVFSLDEQLHRMWGYWRGIGAAESYARDVMRGKPYPEIFIGQDLGIEIEELIGKLSQVNLLLEPEVQDV